MLIWQCCISAAVPSPSSSKSSSNCFTLLSACQAELFQDLGHLLDKGTPTAWVEICIVTDLILWTSMSDKKINKKPLPQPQPGIESRVFTKKIWKCRLVSHLRHPPGPLGARDACAVNPWVLTTVVRDYRLQFATKLPTFSGVGSVATREATKALESKISSLFSRGAIRGN